MKKDYIDKKRYQRIHYWLKVNYGKPDNCENVECKGISKKFEWALLKGKKYDFVRANFIRLCRSCHSKYDLTEDGKNRISEYRKGKKHANETKEKIRTGNIGKNMSSCYRKVYLYKNNKLIKTFESLTQAGEWLGVKASRISLAASPKYYWTHTVKGYEPRYSPTNNKPKQLTN